MKKKLITTVTLVLFLFLLSGNVGAKILYVGTDTLSTGGSGTGLSASSPYKGDSTLHTFLASSTVATGDEIRLQSGTYINPSGAVDAFVISKNLTIKGGYNANFGNNNTGTTTLRNDNNNANNSYRNQRIINITATGAVTLENISIVGGNNSRTTANGGGIYAPNNGALTLIDVIITNCTASSGSGGGIYKAGTGALTMTGVNIRGCSSTGGSNFGGGIYAGTSGTMTMTEVNITGNSAAGKGGGIYKAGSGTLTMREVTITGNASNNATQGAGGGIYISSGSVNITSGLMANNTTAGANGGAIHNASSGTLTLRNVTIAGNSAATAGGGVYKSAGTNNFYNSIILGNTTPTAAYADLYYTSTNPTYGNMLIGRISNSGSAQTAGLRTGSSFNGTTYTTGDVFEGFAVGNYTLKSSSPAIGAGTSANYGTPTVTAATIDLARNLRLNGTIDLGPFEFVSGVNVKNMWYGSARSETAYGQIHNWTGKFLPILGGEGGAIDIYIHPDAVANMNLDRSITVRNIISETSNRNVTVGGNVLTITGGLQLGASNTTMINAAAASAVVVLTATATGIPKFTELNGTDQVNDLVLQKAFTLTRDLKVNRDLSLPNADLTLNGNKLTLTNNIVGTYLIDGAAANSGLILTGGATQVIPLLVSNHIPYLELQSNKSFDMQSHLTINSSLNLVNNNTRISTGAYSLAVNNNVTGSGSIDTGTDGTLYIMGSGSDSNAALPSLRNNTVNNLGLEDKARTLSANTTVNGILMLDVNLTTGARSLTLNGTTFSDGGAINANNNNSVVILGGSNASQNIPPFVGNAAKSLTLSNTAKQFVWDASNTLAIDVDLTIDAASPGVIVASNGFLKVGGKTTGSTTDKLLIQTDASGNNGSFVTGANNGGTPVRATVEFAPKSRSPRTGTTAMMQWQYFGIPVTTYNNIGENLYGAWIREYVQNAGQYWAWLNNSSTLTAGKGYEISIPDDYAAGYKFRFAGDLVTTDRVIPVGYTASDRFPGQLVISNPFTAALNVSTGITFNAQMQATVYLFGTGTSQQWDTNGNATVTAVAPAAGQYISIPQATLGSTVNIPSMQGFVVKTQNTTAGSVTLKYSGAVKNDRPMYSKGVESGELRVENEENPLESASSAFHYTDIQLLESENRKLSDRAWIFVDESTTRTFDNGYDGEKMFGAAKLSQLYAVEADGNYQVNAVPDMQNTSLNMKAEEGVSSYTLRFAHHNMADKYDRIFLTDLLTNTVTDITEDGSEYAFTATNEQEAEKRFLIGVQKKDIDNTDVATGLEITQHSDMIHISNRNDVNAVVSIYNISGQMLSQVEVPAVSDRNIPESSFTAGVYIIKATAEGKKDVTTKVIVK